MTEHQDSEELMRVRPLRAYRVGLAVYAIGASCWSVLVGGGGYLLGLLVYMSAGGVIGDHDEPARSYMNSGWAITVAATVLAAAPWLVVAILVGVVLWKSKAPSQTRATE